MTNYSAFYSEQIPVLLKKIVKQKYNSIIKKSFLLGLVSLAFTLLFAFLANNQEMFTVLFRIQNILFLLAPLLAFVFSFKIRKYLKTGFKYEGK